MYGFRSISRGEHRRSYFHASFKRGNWEVVRRMSRLDSRSNKESALNPSVTTCVATTNGNSSKTSTAPKSCYKHSDSAHGQQPMELSLDEGVPTEFSQNLHLPENTPSEFGKSRQQGSCHMPTRNCNSSVVKIIDSVEWDLEENHYSTNFLSGADDDSPFESEIQSGLPMYCGGVGGVVATGHTEIPHSDHVKATNTVVVDPIDFSIPMLFNEPNSIRRIVGLAPLSEATHSTAQRTAAGPLYLKLFHASTGEVHPTQTPNETVAPCQQMYPPADQLEGDTFLLSGDLNLDSDVADILHLCATLSE